jgi:hypothetical protein
LTPFSIIKPSPKKIYISSSDKTDDDFMSEKDVKKKHKKYMQSVEKRKNESHVDNSPVKMNLNKVNGAESSSRKGEQTVLKDQKSLNNIQTKSVIRDLSITLERLNEVEQLIFNLCVWHYGTAWAWLFHRPQHKGLGPILHLVLYL